MRAQLVLQGDGKWGSMWVERLMRSSEHEQVLGKRCPEGCEDQIDLGQNLFRVARRYVCSKAVRFQLFQLRIIEKNFLYVKH